MSEEQILNKAAVTGVIASGGVGSVSTPASQLGPVGTAKPSDGGGILNAEQSAQFIEYIFEQQVLARDGRRVTMRGNTAELEKLSLIHI